MRLIFQRFVVLLLAAVPPLSLRSLLSTASLIHPRMLSSCRCYGVCQCMGSCAPGMLLCFTAQSVWSAGMGSLSSIKGGGDAGEEGVVSSE